MASALAITERHDGDIATLSLRGRLLGEEEDTLFTTFIDGLLSAGWTRIVLDMHDVSFIDSGGIGILVAKFLSARRQGGDLRLANLSDRTRRVLAITHLLTVFSTFDSIDEAVDSYTRHEIPPQPPAFASPFVP